jgi:DNA-binding transcriptional ArsR family regulator
MKSTIKDSRTVQVMEVLGDDSRYAMYKLLLKGEDLCVGEIAARIGISISAVSQHFRSFESAGLIDKVRKGQKICYRLRSDDQFVKKLIRFTKGTI